MHNLLIPIFDPELHIAHLIQNNKTSASVALVSPDHINIDELKEIIKETPSKHSAVFDAEEALQVAMAAIEQDDLMPLSSILVSSIWNANDDVFDAKTLVEAVETPKFKPINWMHRGSEARGNEIIGVMVHTQLLKGPIDELSAFEDGDINVFASDLTGQVHIRQDGLIWKNYFPTYADKVEKGKKEGDLFVSMECFFRNFGFALKKPDGSITLVERNEDNAAFSLALRAFGGPGELEDGTKVGRWIRGANFSGQGVVDRPANRLNGKPLSVILTDAAKHGMKDKKSKKKNKSLPTYSGQQGNFYVIESNGDSLNYGDIVSNEIPFDWAITQTGTGNFSPVKTFVYKSTDETVKGDFIMTDNVEKRIASLEAELKKVQDERDEAVRRLAEAKETDLQTQVDELKEVNSTLESTKADVEKQNAELQERIQEVDSVKAELDEAKKENEKLQEQLDEIRALELGRERFEKIKSLNADLDLGYAAEDFAAMSIETFEAIEKTVEKALAGVSGESKLTDQGVSGASKLTDQGVSSETKLTEASDKNVEEATEALEETEEEDEADLLVTASHDSGNDVARMLVRKIALKRED